MKAKIRAILEKYGIDDYHWKPEITKELSDLFKELKAEAEKDVSDTEVCHKCGGRTALVTGSFYYEPDAEPYENGIEEEAKVGTGECWAGGYKCDDCGNVQGLWHE